MTDGLSSPLIEPAALAERLTDPHVRVIDCRAALADAEAGRNAWLEAHIPGAIHADLELDLSGPPASDRGRHPLPAPARLCEVFGRLGIDAHTAVCAYDDCHGMFAARLWWMLRYMGHSSAAVLDGGWPAWVGAGYAVTAGEERVVARRFAGTPRRDRLVALEGVPGAELLVDARDPARFRGEIEPVDPRAGHIPGARNHFWRMNVAGDGRLLDPGSLRRQFDSSLGILPDAKTVHYCGSGVSACHNVLAQVAAGLPEPKLYCGSWSEWSRDPARPAAPGREMSA